MTPQRFPRFPSGSRNRRTHGSRCGVSPRRVSKTDARRLRGAARRQRALELRLARKSYAAIAAELGISRQSAHKLVMTALDEIRTKTAEDAAKVRDLELQRLEAIEAKLWEKRGEPRVADSLFRAMERRARLEGLDAPIQVEGTLLTGALSDDERAERVAALLDRARARRAQHPAPGAVDVAPAAGPADAGVPQPG
jgi:hypothetical protein